MSKEEVSIFRTLKTIEAEEEALRYCNGCGGTFAELHFGNHKLCQTCRDDNTTDIDEWVYGVDTLDLDYKKAAIIRLIRLHRAEFDELLSEEMELRIED